MKQLLSCPSLVNVVLEKSTSLASASKTSGVSNGTLSPSDYHLLVQARERLVSLWISVAAASFPPCSDAASGPCVARGPVPDTTIFRLLYENPSPSRHLVQGFNDNDIKTDMEVSRSLFETYMNDPLGGVEKLALLLLERWSRGDGARVLCAVCASSERILGEMQGGVVGDFWQVVGC
ncbi:hypothetical protein BDP27DRAFT_835967 [Rhodocollybia butyracea]|uniref:Uncharacterized protein n=1 Tax=Rhodocollybia butyracea TaxID=206335 RepID=A0A9P5P4N9_9AGAR|nr:hypothetical protein BDP27DRAFT_835967 [Rhodocollybia butyracea]